MSFRLGCILGASPVLGIVPSFLVPWASSPFPDLNMPPEPTGMGQDSTSRASWTVRDYRWAGLF